VSQFSAVGTLIRSLGPRQFALNFGQPRCLVICAIVVQGSRGSRQRFLADLDRAQDVFGCANLSIQAGGFMEVVDPTLLDLTGWTTTSRDADTMRLLAMGPACGQERVLGQRPFVYAYYVRTLGGGYNGIGATTFANNAPGLVVSDASGDYTLAHEIGHILGLSHVPDTQTDNVMYRDSPNITSVPPVITTDQCDLAFRASAPRACAAPVSIPRFRIPRPAFRPPFETTPALVGLLSDEPGLVEQFAARGQAILPDLLARVNDPNLAIRIRVLAILARIGGPSALQALQRAVQTDPSPSVRSTAAAALAGIGTPMATTLLTGAMQETDPGVRAAVLRSLAQVRTPVALMNVRLAALQERNPIVRSLANRLAIMGR
jgi:hypothetical protein